MYSKLEILDLFDRVKSHHKVNLMSVLMCNIKNSNGIYIVRRRGPDRRRHVPDNRTSPSESGAFSLARALHQSA